MLAVVDRVGFSICMFSLAIPVRPQSFLGAVGNNHHKKKKHVVSIRRTQRYAVAMRGCDVQVMGSNEESEKNCKKLLAPDVIRCPPGTICSSHLRPTCCGALGGTHHLPTLGRDSNPVEHDRDLVSGFHQLLSLLPKQNFCRIFAFANG